MKNPLLKRSSEGFTLMEVIVALAVLLMVMSSFSAILHRVRRIEGAYAVENRAIVVLNNLVERLEAESNWDQNTVHRVLKDEFDESRLGERTELRTECRLVDGRLHVMIVKIAGKIVAEVEL